MTDQYLEKRIDALEERVRAIELIRKRLLEEAIAENSDQEMYAINEMARLGWMDEDTDSLQKEMVRCVLELMRVFDKQGHSGFSAPYCLNLFDRLARWRPISPLTGEDDEWNEITPKLYQNKRYSAVFKEKGTGRAYNIEGRVFTRDNGETWYTCGDSTIDISFPYTVPDEPEEVYLESEVGDNG